MAPISVYGYNTNMLAYPEGDPEREAFTEDSRDEVMRSKHHQLTPGSTSCPLLAVPLEIRASVYSFVLPAAIEHSDKGTAWLRGSIAILATNKQIYHEAVEMMYGINTFIIDVGYDFVTFAYQWILPSGLVPKTTIALLEKFPKRNLALIRRYLIRVHMVDSYTGMIKYNVTSLSPLAVGVQSQVLKLVNTLQVASEIFRLQIHLVISEWNPELYLYGNIALSPFLGLKNVSAIFLSGRIPLDFQKKLRDCVTDACVTSSAHEFCTWYPCSGSHRGLVRDLDTCCA